MHLPALRLAGAFLITLLFSPSTYAAPPTEEQARGSSASYSVPESPYTPPDSLEIMFVNHVGRHGARWASSDKNIAALEEHLTEALAAGRLTAQGSRLLADVQRALRQGNGRWGLLDSLGVAEQEGIAGRLYRMCPQLVAGCTAVAEASPVNRCMASMEAFTTRLNQLAGGDVEISQACGPRYIAMLRPFAVSRAYADFTRSRPYAEVYDAYRTQMLPLLAVDRWISGPIEPKEKRNILEEAVSFFKSDNAWQAGVRPTQYMTLAQWRRCWAVGDLQQYLARTSTRISPVPGEITDSLIRNLVSTTEAFISGSRQVTLHLRFGHAETLLPLLSQLRVPGCSLQTENYGSVPAEWRNFEIVPMAANYMLILLRSPATGRWYVQALHNERPVTLLPGDPRQSVPWGEARAYMLSRLAHP